MLASSLQTKCISSKEALEALKNHPLKRNPKISYAFGLYEGDRLVGVVTYGSPASPSVCKGICGESERLNVIELNRMWVSEGVPKREITSFIKSSLDRVGKEIVISYVLPRNEWITEIFKEIGFYYLGLTDKHRDPVPVGELEHRHNRHAHYELSKVNLVHRPRKHRFVYFNANADRNHQLFNKLRYDVYFY